MILSVESTLLRRGAALALLFGALLVLAPPVVAPLRQWLDDRAAVEEERSVAERVARVNAERAAVLAAADAPDPPFVVAADGAQAQATLSSRVLGAVPAGAVEITLLEPILDDQEAGRPNGPARLRISFDATPSGLSAFLGRLEGDPPHIRVAELDVSVVPGPGEPVVLSGSAVLSVPVFHRDAR